MSGGHFYLGGGTAVQQATGHEDSAEEMYKYLIAAPKEPEPDKIRAYCEGSVEHFDWLETLGFEFERSYYPEKAVIQPGTQGLMFTGNEKVWPYLDQARPAPRGHKVPGARRHRRHQAGDGPAPRRGSRRPGVEVRYETGATNLVTSSPGAWSGWLEVASTRPGVVRAGAVVLAAGGFVMNPDMVAAHTPALGSKLFTLGSTYDDGLGIRLGASVGGELKHMDEPFITAPFYPPSVLVKGLIVNKARRAVRRRGQLPRADVVPRDASSRTQAAYLIVDSAHMEQPRMPLCPLIDGWETVEEMEPALGLPDRVAGQDPRPLQRARRARRGPGLPQAPRLAGAAGHRPVGRLRPDPRQGAVRRLHPRRPADAPSTARCSGPTAR